MGTTVSTTLRLRNLTNSAIVSVFAFDLDDFDFGRDSRPDILFNRAPHQIPPGGYIEKIIELNHLASNCPFTLRLKFANGREDVFKINYKCVYDDTEPNLRHLKKCHAIILHIEEPKILEVSIKNTIEQKENEEALRLKDEAELLLLQDRYDEALGKLWEASDLANELQAKLDINTSRKNVARLRTEKRDNSAMALYSEGCEFMKNYSFNEALNKFKDALKYAKDSDTIDMINNNINCTKQQKNHQDMKKLNQEGLLLKKMNQNQEALQKFDEALHVTDNVEPELILSIKRNKSEVLRRLAQSILEETYEFEKQAKLVKAIVKFTKVEEYLIEANSIFPSMEFSSLIKSIGVKIQGNKYLLFAQRLESEASELQQKVEGTNNEDILTPSIRRKYVYSKQQYEEAKRIFEEGANDEDVVIKFDENLTYVQKCLQNIELHIIDQMDY